MSGTTRDGVKSIIPFGMILLVLLGFVASADDNTNITGRSVILLIGDGMGQAQMTAARWVESGENLSNYTNTNLYMDTVDHTGYVTTFSFDSLITDSAAAGTAIATGQKTNIGVISQDSSAEVGVRDGKTLDTILELAKESGKSTGVVTTTRITHATPAVFYSHVNDRDQESEIADQLVQSQVDVALGGGLSYFTSANDTDRFGSKGKRKDGSDLISNARDFGYVIVYNDSELSQVDSNTTQKLLGLFQSSHMTYELQRNGTSEPELVNMTKTALDILSKNDQGFFLMVEGGRIDHASHERSFDNTTAETIEFDKTVKVALDYASSHNNTLVIITADHECGGLVLGAKDTADYRSGMTPVFASGLTKTPGPRYDFTEMDEATHTAVDVPILAQGLMSDQIHGKMDNTWIFYLMKEAMGL